MTKNLTKPLAFLSAAAMLVTMLLYLPGSVFSNIGLELTANAEEITPTEPSTDADGVYQIGTAAELYWFANAVNSGNNSASAKLTESITVNDSLLALLEYDAEGNVTNGGSFISWTPICRTGYYTGTFDGNGKSVSGLFFDDSTVNYVGLFGYIGSGKITNVSIADSYIRGKQYVGGVC